MSQRNCVHPKILLLACIISSVLGADPTDLTRLRSDLLTGYDKNARPVPAHKNTVEVQINPWIRGFEITIHIFMVGVAYPIVFGVTPTTITLTLQKHTEVYKWTKDESRSIFTLYCWTVMGWNDWHLKWEPKNYGNITYIHFAAHEIWQPDISVYNNLDQSEVDHFGNTRVIAYSNGRVTWVPPTKFQVGCATDLRQWPYDRAMCIIVIGSWSHDGNMLDISVPTNLTELGGNQIVENREWVLEKTQVERRQIVYSDIPYPGTQIFHCPDPDSNTNQCNCHANYKTQTCNPYRSSSRSWIGAILISFWLRPGASERLALILLIILINALYLNRIYTQLGTHGDSVPLVLLFYRDSLVMVSVALVWTIILRYLAATKRTSPVPLPGFIGSFLESLPAKILCLDPRPVQGSPAASNGGTEDEGKLVSGGNPNQADWAWLAHLLDRVAFVIYFIVYVCFYVALL